MYKRTNWINHAETEDGKVIQRGTPLSAENLNNIEETLEEVANSRGNPNGIATLNESGFLRSSQIPINLKEMHVVADITERDNLSMYEGMRVLVRDASEDSTVDSGWAEYVYDGSDYVKVAEAESLDIHLTWDGITGKPTEFKPSGHSHDYYSLDNRPKNLETVEGSQEKAVAAYEESKTYTDQEIALIPKPDLTIYDTHIGDSGIHVTPQEKATWNSLISSIPTLEWNAIVDKPEEFTPTPHTHVEADISDLDKYTKAEVDVKLEAKSDKTHTHAYNDLTGVPPDLETTSGSQAKADNAVQESLAYTDAQIASLVDTAPEALDTLSELADALGNDPNFATSVATSIGSKADKSVVDTHISNKSNPHGVTKSQVGLSNVDNVKQASKAELDAHMADDVSHVTSAQRADWNAKETPSGAQAKVDAHANVKTNPHGVTKAQVGLGSVDNVKQASKTEFDSHTSDAVKHISAAERTAWNGKADGNHSHTWASITGKPTTFAPTSHTHSEYALKTEVRRIYTSMSGPSGGADGDIWIKYE